MFSLGSRRCNGAETRLDGPLCGWEHASVFNFFHPFFHILCETYLKLTCKMNFIVASS